MVHPLEVNGYLITIHFPNEIHSNKKLELPRILEQFTLIAVLLVFSVHADEFCLAEQGLHVFDGS